MATSGDTLWEKKVERQEARRLRGISSTMQDAVIKGLDSMIGVFSPVTEGTRNSDTTAVGYLPASLFKEGGGDFLLFVVFKGAKKVSAEEILENVPLGWGKGRVVFVPNSYEEIGTHAESQILMYLSKDLGFNIKNLGALGLRIACGSKGCCPDCAGLLAKYGIPHTKSREKIAAQWRHPRTEAYFKGTGKELLYSKESVTGKGYVSASHQNPK